MAFTDFKEHIGRPDATQNIPGTPELGRPNFSGIWRCGTTDSRALHYATLYAPLLLVQDRSTLTVRVAGQDGLLFKLNGTVDEATSDVWEIYRFDGRDVSTERPAHRVCHSVWERDRLVTITTEGCGLVTGIAATLRAIG